MEKKSEKGYLGIFPETPFQSIANFLNMREAMTVSFVNKKLHANTEVCRTKFKNLLDCVRASMIYEMGVRLLQSHAKCTDYYDISKEFNYKNRQIRIRTFTDFAKNFIMEKNVDKYRNLVAKLSNMCKEIDDWPAVGKATNRPEFKEFMSEFIKAAGFKYEDIANGKYKSDFQNSNVKKQIQNSEKPKRDDYIKDHNELKK